MSTFRRPVTVAQGIQRPYPQPFAPTVEINAKTAKRKKKINRSAEDVDREK